MWHSLVSFFGRPKGYQLLIPLEQTANFAYPYTSSDFLGNDGGNDGEMMAGGANLMVWGGHC